MKRKAKRAVRSTQAKTTGSPPAMPRPLYLEIEEDLISVERLVDAARIIGNGAPDSMDSELGKAIKQIADEMQRYLERIKNNCERDLELRRKLKDAGEAVAKAA